MSEQDTPCDRLQDELHALRARVAELERAAAEHANTEELLRQSEALYRSVIEGAIQGIAVQQDGVFHYVNPALARIFGYDGPGDLVGQRWEILVAPEEQAVLRGRVAAALGGSAVRTHSGWRGRRRDGTTLWVESGLSAIDWQGRPAILSYLIDVTDRQRTENDLRHERDLLHSLLDSTPDHIYFKDVTGRYLRVNPAKARRLGLEDPAAAVGRTDFDFYPEEYARDTQAEERRLLETGEPVVARDCRVVGPDGRERWSSTTKVLFRDPTGQVVGTLGISRDVTEQRQLEEQLRQAVKMEAVGRLAGGIAHDFNNLLTTITGYGDLVLAALRPDDSCAEHLKEIRRATDRAAALTRQLLAFSRRQILAPTVLDLNAVVADAEKLLRPLLGEDVVLAARLEPELWRVRADAGQVQQVLLNLAANARDAMPAGGRLTVETRNVPAGEGPGPAALLAVADTGCGMDEQTKAHLFEPFFTTKGVGKGTGLGLATVYGIVKQAGGRIEVRSEPGRGSTFAIYLPRAEAAEVTPAPAGEPPRGGHETVLLVEDEEVVRGLARTILTMHGYRVLEARGGIEALRICETHGEPIHLLLTDVIMPEMSGRQVAERVKGLRPGVRVLYMSGYTDDAALRQGVLAAEAGFLPKPFTPDGMARKVREVLDQQRV